MYLKKVQLHLRRTFSRLTTAILLVSLISGMQGPFPARATNNQTGLLDPTFGTGGFATTVYEIYSAANAAIVQADDKIITAGGDYWYGHFMLTRHHIDGSLDTTFGVNGKVTTRVENLAKANAVLLQADDKIVAAGIASQDSTDFDFALVRYNSDGSLDTFFGTDGIVTTDFGGANSGNALVLQIDGKIVLAGTTGADFALARYNTNGSLDTSFGTNGKVTTDLGGVDVAAAAVLQSDGRIVLAGTTGTDFALARYNTNGSLDTSFGTNGKVTTDLGGADSGNALALQSDGKIILAGTDGTDFALARYNPNGSLDTSFGTNGKVTTDLGGADSGNALALQSGGKIILAGTNGADFALARYNPNGSLDASFGVGGKMTNDFGGNDASSAVVLQSDGPIVVVGNSDTSGYGRDTTVILASYSSNGILVTTYHPKVSTNFGNTSTANGSAMALQPDGKIIVAGSAYFNASSYDFVLARYMADGSLDAGFGTGGKVTTDFGDDESGNAVAVRSDGRIVVAGYSSVNYGPRNFALAQYTSDGSLDTSFGIGGKVVTDFGYHDYGNAMVLQPDGKILVAGTSNSNFALARYDSNGNLDNSFGISGKATTDFGGSENGKAIALQPDGKIVVAGDSYHNSTYNIVLARYNSNGSLDIGAVVDFGSSAEAEEANAIALQPDGKIVVAGNASTLDFTQDVLFMARFNSNITVDTGFGTNGQTLTDFGGIGNAVAIQSDGKIVVAGNYSLAQFNRDGSLDASFSEDGKVRTDVMAHAVAFQPDGMIVVAGNNNLDFALARYQPAPLLPAITDFTPLSGLVGTSVTITGTNFTGANRVEFNGVDAAFSVVSDTTISATVPMSAKSGPISVTAPGGTATSSADFTVTYVVYLPMISR